MKSHLSNGPILLVFVLVEFACSGFGQVNLGKCNQTWNDSCTGAKATNVCQSPCKVTIAPDATVTRQGGGSADTICVKKGDEVDWTQPNVNKFFLVYFGLTTPFDHKSGLSAAAGGTDGDQISQDAFECNKYIVLYCGFASCVTKDPIVIVQGGHGFGDPVAIKRDSESLPSFKFAP